MELSPSAYSDLSRVSTAPSASTVGRRHASVGHEKSRATVPRVLPRFAAMVGCNDGSGQLVDVHMYQNKVALSDAAYYAAESRDFAKRATAEFKRRREEFCHGVDYVEAKLADDLSNRGPIYVFMTPSSCASLMYDTAHASRKNTVGRRLRFQVVVDFLRHSEEIPELPLCRELSSDVLHNVYDPG